MHNIYLPNFYYFVKSLDIKNILHLDHKVAIIYRNYDCNHDIEDLIKFKNYCKKTKRKFLIANKIALAFKLKLDGVYLPSFNKKMILKKYINFKKFILVGSAHNLKEIRIKEKQQVMQIFLSPIFKDTTRNKCLGINNFNNLCKYTKKPIIALGGINKNKLKLLKQVKAKGFAAINFFKKYESINYNSQWK
tara:strand:+ start:2251 stop:2823 length:573 start_codon:yes stop_codon:yes gene_type:complete